MTPSHPVPRWRAAGGSAIITPREACCLGGYTGREQAFASISDPLEINALLLDDGNEQVVIASLDLLYVGAALRDLILARLAPARKPASVLLAASHTHYAPMTQLGTPRLGAANTAYTDWVAARAAELINSLNDRLEPVDATYQETAADHSVNRRLVRWRLSPRGVRRRCEMAPNPAAGRDETVGLLRFTTPGGMPVATLWNYACHPTGYPQKLSVTAEFPGVVRSALRDAAATPMPVVFVLGFCGDTRPPFTTRGLGSLAKRICAGPQFATPTESEWRAWANSLAERVRGALDAPRFPLTPGPLVADCCAVPLTEFAEGPSAQREMAVQHIALGEALSLLAVEAEPVTGYRRLAEAAFGGRKLMTAGCIGEVFGYLPADDMLAQGGYEAGGFAPYFNFDARFRGSVEQAVQRAFQTLADRMETVRLNA